MERFLTNFAPLIFPFRKIPVLFCWRGQGEGLAGKIHSGDDGRGNASVSGSGGSGGSVGGVGVSEAAVSSTASTPRVSLDGVKVVLLDIEGTTTPITFVHNTLFPYARWELVASTTANHNYAISTINTELVLCSCCVGAVLVPLSII